jgi:predicted transcriptional regulator
VTTKLRFCSMSVIASILSPRRRRLKPFDFPH